MVADGLGHGPEAAVAARLAGGAFEDEPFATPEQFYQLAHRSLKGSRGAVLARAIIGRSGDVQYSGIGNIAGSVVGSERSRGLASENGTVGVAMLDQDCHTTRDFVHRADTILYQAKRERVGERRRSAA